MHTKKELGTVGEDIAAKYLIEQNYKIITRNFMCRQGEIDIIARDTLKKEIVFIEVKTRTSQKYGSPSEAVDENKQKILDSYPLDKLLKFSRFNINGPRFDELKGNPIDSVKLLRQLHNFKNLALISLTDIQKNKLFDKYNEILNFEKINNNENFEINPWAFKLMDKPNEFITKIDNIYMVSSNIENIIRKCVSGLGPRISKNNMLKNQLLF